LKIFNKIEKSFTGVREEEFRMALKASVKEKKNTWYHISAQGLQEQ